MDKTIFTWTNDAHFQINCNSNSCCAAIYFPKEEAAAAAGNITYLPCLPFENRGAVCVLGTRHLIFQCPQFYFPDFKMHLLDRYPTVFQKLWDMHLTWVPKILLLKFFPTILNPILKPMLHENQTKLPHLTWRDKVGSSSSLSPWGLMLQADREPRFIITQS